MNTKANRGWEGISSEWPFGCVACHSLLLMQVSLTQPTY